MSAELRCAVCGWPVRERTADGCTKDNCSMRPRPTAFTPELQDATTGVNAAFGKWPVKMSDAKADAAIDFLLGKPAASSEGFAKALTELDLAAFSMGALFSKPDPDAPFTAEEVKELRNRKFAAALRYATELEAAAIGRRGDGTFTRDDLQAVARRAVTLALIDVEQYRDEKRRNELAGYALAGRMRP